VKPGEGVQVFGPGGAKEPERLCGRGGGGLFSQGVGDLRADPSCAEPLRAARAVVGLLETLMLKSDYRDAGNVAERFMPVVMQAGETPELVAAYYYRTLSLVQRGDAIYDAITNNLSRVEFFAVPNDIPGSNEISAEAGNVNDDKNMVSKWITVYTLTYEKV
jgi:hypothetical protein